MNTIVVLLVISAVVNVALIYSSYVTVKKIEIYEDNSVTIRERDTMKQERIMIDRLPEIIKNNVTMKQLLI